MKHSFLDKGIIIMSLFKCKIKQKEEAVKERKLVHIKITIAGIDQIFKRNFKPHKGIVSDCRLKSLTSMSTDL